MQKRDDRLEKTATGSNIAEFMDIKREETKSNNDLM